MYQSLRHIAVNWWVGLCIILDQMNSSLWSCIIVIPNNKSAQVGDQLLRPMIIPHKSFANPYNLFLEGSDVSLASLIHLINLMLGPRQGYSYP